jgi:hypothetical protein
MKSLARVTLETLFFSITLWILSSWNRNMLHENF